MYYTPVHSKTKSSFSKTSIVTLVDSGFVLKDFIICVTSVFLMFHYFFLLHILLFGRICGPGSETTEVIICSKFNAFPFSCNDVKGNTIQNTHLRRIGEISFEVGGGVVQYDRFKTVLV